MKTVVLERGALYCGPLVLVSLLHPCRGEGAAPALIPVSEEHGAVLLERRAAALLWGLMERLHGWSHILPVSGWRSMEEQTAIYTRSLEENGGAYTARFVARPGHSEHQTGLAVDLGARSAKLDFICPEFPYHGICQTFREQALPFGFIERYPKGREGITGIAHEPWHFRYVGAPHAEVMSREGLTLEEYIAFLREYPYGVRCYDTRQKNGAPISISYLRAHPEGDTTVEIEGDVPYTISGNNVDGFILTEWRTHDGRR